MSDVKTVLFPGSFDPLTNGHVDIVNRALQVFDRVLVGVLTNPNKQYLFSTDERISLISREFESLSDRVIVKSFSGLLVDFAKQQNVQVVLRGLRAISDFDYEAQMALLNRKLSGSIETLFMVAREENSYISSTLVKQVAPFGGNIEGLVPAHVRLALLEKYQIVK